MTKFSKVVLVGLMLFWFNLLCATSPKEITDKTSTEVKKLFEGDLGKDWNELSAYGGNFKKFARLEDKTLLVEVLAGNSWGKTGIRSTEPVIKFPEKDELFAMKLNFKFDPSRSSDFVLALIPANWDGNLEWRSHHVRVGYETSEDGKNSVLTLIFKGREIMRSKLGSQSIESIGIIVRPDRLVLITDGSGSTLLQGQLPDNLPNYKDGYRISVLAHALKKGMAAKLALKTISLENAPYERIVDLSVLQDKPQKLTLFDGKIMGQRWKSYLNAKVKFDDVAKISSGSLNVDVPDMAGLANAGIQSIEPVIWLDQFGKGSKRELLFNLVSAQTTGFAVALSNNRHHFIVKWFNDAEKDKAFIQIYQSTSLTLVDNWHSKFKPVWEKEVSTTAPKQVKLRLEPKGIILSSDQLPEHFQAWPYLHANAGYFIYAFSFPSTPNLEVKMALKEISLDNKTFKPIESTKAISEAEPLPVVEMFSGAKREGWQITKKPVDACHLNELGFGVTPNSDKKPSSGCDIHTEKPILNIDKRIDSTNYQISAYFDPQKTRNFRIAVTPHQRHNWNKYYKAHCCPTV